MKYGIIAAMEEEKQLLEERLEQKQESIIAGWHFLEGTLMGQPVVLVQSGIGKVMSAIATTLLIQQYHVDFVINTGSAGGLQAFLGIGDVVVATELAYSDVDVTAFGYEYGQLPKMPVRYQCDKSLLPTMIRAAQQIGLTATSGLIVSADSFIHTMPQYDFLLQQFPDVYATEMEGAAIAQVCHMFEIPFLIIRAISDLPKSGTSAVSFDEFIIEAGRKSAEMVCVYLQTVSKKSSK